VINWPDHPKAKAPLQVHESNNNNLDANSGSGVNYRNISVSTVPPTAIILPMNGSVHASRILLVMYYCIKRSECNLSCHSTCGSWKLTSPCQKKCRCPVSGGNFSRTTLAVKRTLLLSSQALDQFSRLRFVCIRRESEGMMADWQAFLRGWALSLSQNPQG
jgi:hypothetical protein